MSNTIHALLVGIDNYHPDSYQVSPLTCCVKDVEEMSKHLHLLAKERALTVKPLLNEQATKDNIIASFKELFCNPAKVKAGDFVLFYFSGHGSYANTPAALAAYDTQQTDETLVCYDSRTPDKHDLIDKEIAFLLEQIRSDVEIILIIDACHSGSITRGGKRTAASAVALADQLEERFVPPCSAKKTHRQEDYIFNANQSIKFPKNAAKRFVLPHSKHIVFSACSRNEKSYGQYGRGIFSFNLLKIWAAHDYVISYAKLFELTRAVMLKNTARQNPGLSISGHFNPQKVMLSHHIMNAQLPYVVRCINGDWYLNQGTVHGLPSNGGENISMQVALYKKEIYTKCSAPFQTVTISKVHFCFSKLDFQHSNSKTCFQAAIIKTTNCIPIHICGDEQSIKHFNGIIASTQPAHVVAQKNPKNAEFEIRVQPNQYSIHKISDGKMIHGCSRKIDFPETYILNCFKKIHKYIQLKGLANPKTLLATDHVSFQFLPETLAVKKENEADNKFSVPYSTTPIPYELKACNKSNTNYYIALIYFSAQYGIALHHCCSEFHSSTLSAVVPALPLGKKRQLLLSANQTNCEHTFKIIVSTEPFPDYHFMEENLEPVIIKKLPATRKEELKRSVFTVEGDWFTKTIQVELNN